MPYLLERWLKLLALAEAFAIVLISFASGYLRLSQPKDFVWESTPLGMLFSFNPHFPKFQSACYFAGIFGQHWDYAGIFLAVFLLEMGIYFWFFPKEVVQEKRLFLPLTMNFLTHPVVFFAIPCLNSSYLASLFVGQAYAFALEGLIFKWQARTCWRRALLASGCANFISWQVGSFLLSI